MSASLRPRFSNFGPVIFLSLYALVIVLSLLVILTGRVSFWHDNARDLLLSLDNLQKFSLLGPVSGLPGINYGPQWIWFLSLAGIFSHDPRLAFVLAGLLPTFILFPLWLFTLKNRLHWLALALPYAMYVTGIGQAYLTNIWSPHLAPLLFLGLLLILISAEGRPLPWRRLFLAGVVGGLLIHVHISFGIAITLGSLVLFLTRREFLKSATFYLMGLGLTFTPQFIFEIRHGFSQTASIIRALLQFGGVVEPGGLSRPQIISALAGKFSEITAVPLATVIVIALIILVLLKSKLILVKPLNKFHRQLLLMLFIYSLSLLLLYLSVRNPVWGYHLIGSEVIAILSLALVLDRIPITRYLVGYWSIWLIVNYCGLTIKTLASDPLSSGTLAAEEYVTDLIAKDAGTDQLRVYAYSSAIYQYEYSHLFRTRHGQPVPFDPGTYTGDSRIVYLIIPPAGLNVSQDFLDYRTPASAYTTHSKWEIPNGTMIYKRVKNESL